MVTISSNVNQLGFKSNQISNVKTENVSANKNVENKKGLSKGAKVAIGAGLTALAATGIYIATKGKAKGISVDKFYELGNKFEKGIALNKDGSKFSGVLEKVNKDGTLIKMNYKDGKLVETIKNNKVAKRYLDDGSVRIFDHKTKTFKEVSYDPTNKSVNIFEKRKFDKNLEPIGSLFDNGGVQTNISIVKDKAGLPVHSEVNPDKPLVSKMIFSRDGCVYELDGKRYTNEEYLRKLNNLGI